MSAISDTATDWQREVIDLKVQGLSAAEIAEAVGKHAATVRKVIKRHADEVETIAADIERVSDEEGRKVWDGVPIPGQTTVDDFTGEGDESEALNALATGDDVNTLDEDVDPLEEFKAEAGEAVGDMPPREMDAGEIVETAPFVQGTAQLALNFGPNAAPVRGATIVFKSERLESGFFEMGDLVSFSGTARITAINGAEKLDRDIGEFVAKPQAHVALITEIEIEAVGGGA